MENKSVNNELVESELEKNELLDTDLMEYETFEMEIGEEVKEFAIIEEFKVENKHYVAAAPVVDDTISADGCYLFRSLKIENEICIEKIASKEEYEKVSEVYMAL